MIERCTSEQQQGWLELRRELWPHDNEGEHVAEMKAACAQPERFASFVAYDEAGRAIGFVEASARRDYVPGTSSSPVGFLEGIYVVPSSRHQGVGRALVERVERWARGIGCTEMASDALLGNSASHAVHRALGFVEAERVVFFLKGLEE